MHRSCSLCSGRAEAGVPSGRGHHLSSAHTCRRSLAPEKRFYLRIFPCQPSENAAFLRQHKVWRFVKRPLGRTFPETPPTPVCARGCQRRRQSRRCSPRRQASLWKHALLTAGRARLNSQQIGIRRAPPGRSRTSPGCFQRRGPEEETGVIFLQKLLLSPDWRLLSSRVCLQVLGEKLHRPPRE